MPNDVPDRPRTTVSRAESARFETGLRSFFAYRDHGVRDATRGAFAAHVIRAIPASGAEPRWHRHDLGFQFVLILRGWVSFEYEDIGEVTLRPGDSVLQPPMVRHREVAHSEDLELLEVTSPASFETHEAKGAEPDDRHRPVPGGADPS